MTERMIIDPSGRESHVVSSERNKVNMLPFTLEEEAEALKRLIDVGNEISSLEEEVVIMNKAIVSNGEESPQQAESIAESLKKLTEFFKDNPVFKNKPVTHAQILGLVPVLTDMIKHLRQLKIEEQNLVSRLPQEKQMAYQASTETRSKLITGKIHLPEWIAELVEPVSIDKAEEIMGDLMRGPKFVAEIFNTALSNIQVPPLPFTSADLKRAKEQEDFLVLRVDRIKVPQEKDLELTMDFMVKTPRGGDKEVTKVLAYRSTEPESGFSNLIKNSDIGNAFNSDVPRAGWVIIERDRIRNNDPAIDKSDKLLDSTKKLRDRVMSFASDDELAECSDRALEEIVSWKNRDTGKMNALLAKLKINNKYRRTAVEVLYDSMMCNMIRGSRFRHRGEPVISEGEQTLTTDADGKFLYVGWEIGGEEKDDTYHILIYIKNKIESVFSVVRS